MRARVSAGEPEARFYLEIAPTLPVRVPPCVYAAIDPDSGHALVLMEDLVAQGATFLTALSPYSVEQAKGTLDQLAKLHAEHWGDAGPGDVRLPRAPAAVVPAVRRRRAHPVTPRRPPR
jgi:hypothetical protein